MAVQKSDFGLEEWSLLRDTPHLVAAAIASAGRSGLLGTMKEAMVACQQAYAGQQGSSELVQQLSTAEEVKAGQAAIRELVPLSSAASAPEKLRQAAVDGFQGALQLLTTKQATEEIQDYRTWVMDIAKSVAEAAKEGGFLGIGGQRVSDGEADLLAELERAADQSIS